MTVAGKAFANDSSRDFSLLRSWTAISKSMPRSVRRSSVGFLTRLEPQYGHHLRPHKVAHQVELLRRRRAAQGIVNRVDPIRCGCRRFRRVVQDGWCDGGGLRKRAGARARAPSAGPSSLPGCRRQARKRHPQSRRSLVHLSIQRPRAGGHWAEVRPCAGASLRSGRW